MKKVRFEKSKKSSSSKKKAKKPVRIRFIMSKKVNWKSIPSAIGDLIIKLAVWMYYNPILQIVALIVLFFGLNFLASRFDFNLDITQNKIYTLTPATKEILKNLPEPVTVKIFLSEDFPPSIQTIPDEIKAFFEELDKTGKGNLIVEYKYPDSNDTDKDEATQYGIEPVPYADYINDKYVEAQGYLGAVFLYQDQEEPISLIDNPRTLEYDTVSLLKKMTQTEKPKLAFITGHEEKSLFSDYSLINKYLQQQYQVQTVELKGLDILQYDVVILAAPTTNFTNQELLLLDQYLLNNGNLIVLLEGYTVDLQSEAAQAINTNIFEFFKHYGVEFEQGLIMDKSFRPIIVNGYIPVAYPYWIRTLAENFDQSNPTLTNIEAVDLNWAGGLKTNLDYYKDKDNKPTINPLIKTSQESGIFLGDYIPIGLDQDFTYPNKEQRTVASYVNGYQESYFSKSDNKKIINQYNQELKDQKVDKSYLEQASNSNLVVIGDADFISDMTVQDNIGSAAFFFNMIDWMSGDEDIIVMRTKLDSTRPIKAVTDKQKTAIKTINLLLPSLVIITLFTGVSIRESSRKARV